MSVRIPTLQRLLRRRVVDGETGCWLWTGSRKARGGYGEIEVDGRKRRVHAVAYELFVGPIPEGTELDHLCRVTHCFAPWHLEPVPQRENWRRGESPGARAVRTNQCKHGHDLVPGNVYLTPDGRRQCMICQRAYGAAYRARQQGKKDAGKGWD